MKKLANCRFTYFPVLGLIMGIVTCLLYNKGQIFALVISNILVPALFLFLTYKNFKSLLINLLLYLLFFIIGYLILYLWLNYYFSLERDDGIYAVYGKISSISYKDGYTIYSLKNTTLEDGKSIKNLNVILTTTKELDANVGDYIKCFAETKYLLRDFNFSNMFYISEGITYSCTPINSGIEIIYCKKDVFESINLFIKNSLWSNLTKETRGIAYALVVGDISYISNSANEIYKASGMFHVFSVSGFHMSFIAHTLQKMTKRIPVNRYFINIPIILLLFFYCGICGFNICALRSAIMSSCLLMCDCIGKKFDIINATLLGFIISLFITPFNLLNIGCLLSYASLMGIIILARPVKSILKFLPEFLNESLSLSISATLTSFPITLYVFGSMAPIAIIYNIIISPLIYVAFLGVIICLLLSIIFKTLFIYKFCNLVIKIINWILTITKPNIFLIEKSVNYYFMAPYYVGVLCASDLTFFKRKMKIILSIILVVSSIVIIFI